MDRNIVSAALGVDLSGTVALLAEGVDRNPEISGVPVMFPQVALLAEGVDRNQTSHLAATAP